MLKIKLVFYFSFAYAILQVIFVLGLLMEGEKLDIIRSIINAAIWFYFGYGLMTRRGKWDYWLTIVFLGIIVLRGISIIFLTGMAGLSAAFLRSMSGFLIFGAIIFVLAIIISPLLLQKDVRKMFVG